MILRKKEHLWKMGNRLERGYIRGSMMTFSFRPLALIPELYFVGVLVTIMAASIIGHIYLCIF